MLIITDALTPPIANYNKIPNSWKTLDANPAVGRGNTALLCVTGGTSRSREHI